jgi:hypothetical protein
MYIKCINWIAFAYACTSNVWIDELSHTHVHRIYVCESCSINTFDVHVYAKAIQLIHSMYMCMRKQFNLYIRCTYTCTSNVYIEEVLHTHVHRMYKLNRLPIHMYIECCTCVCESYSIYTFDVHGYTKPIQLMHSMYMRMRRLFNLYIRCTCVCESYSIYTFDVHVYAEAIHECINWIGFQYTCTSNV